MHTVTFRPPAIGSSIVPIKLTGEGSIAFTDEGFTVTGRRAASSGRGLMILASIICYAVLSALLQRKFGLSDLVSNSIGAGVGSTFLVSALRTPVAEGEERSHTYSWSNVKKVTWDGTSECLVIVIKGAKPKGGLYILAPHDSALQREIEHRAQIA